MPRIKIIKVPKKKLSAYQVGGEECPEGQKKDEFGNCVTDFEYQPSQQKIGTGIPNINIPTVQNPSKAFAPTTSFNSQPASMQIPQTGFDIWSNPGDITGKNPNDMNMPKQTIVDAQGNKTTKGVVDIGNPKMYETQQTPTGPAKKQNKSSVFSDALKGSNFGKNLGLYTSLVGAGVNLVDNIKRQKEYDKWSRAANLPDNYYAVNTSQDRGDYDINDGIFRPNDMGFKSKGIFANQYQAQQNFVKYGGSMPYAEEGMTIEGDKIVRPAFLPDLPPAIISAPASAQSVPAFANYPVEENASANINTDAEYVLPVQGFKITSGFGHRKAPQGPKGPASSEHNGLDLAVRENSNVFAPMDGVVKSIYSNGAGGNQLLIQHPDGSVSGYAHLNGYNVKVGDRVNKGQVIALSGNTGNSNGPHLHFTWHTPDGKTVDPRTIFDFNLNKGKGKQISNTHNNPLNLHYGSFASEYGAEPGAKDSDGRVAKFPSLEIGIQANKDLMFGPAYNNLTISQARNKWVSGNPNVYNSSTSDIVQAMGGDKKLSNLSAGEKDKLFKLFAKWEGSEGYNIIKNKKLFNTGGQNNNTMKIKIVGVPEETEMAYGGQPPYSGQTDYGLYVGQRNLYKTMAKHPYEDINNSVSEQEETPDNPHVLEAEGGEVISTPEGVTKNIVGKRHSEGGEKLNKQQAPEGSFIFSDTAKMKIGGPILKNFGKSATDKKKYTPAELAKQYNTNLYRAILADPTTDNLQKNTAKRMLDAYERKLAELAIVQEGKKGFPQGIPDIAKPLMERMKGMAKAQEGGQEDEGMARYGGSYGFGGSYNSGLRKFQGDVGGSTVPLNQFFNPPPITTQTATAPAATPAPAAVSPSTYPWFTPFTKANTKEGRITRQGKHLSSLYNPNVANQYQDLDYWAKDYKTKVGKDVNNIEDLQHHIYNEVMQNNPDAVKEMWDNYGPTLKNDERNQFNFADAKAGARTAFLMGKRPTKPTIPWIPPPGTVDTTTTLPPGTPPTTTTTTLNPGEFIPGKTKVPWDFLQQDINNMGSAAMNLALMKKYHMQSRNVQPVLPEFIPQDWRGYAASLQSGQNAAAQQLGTYQPGQSLASNLSFLQGQTAGDLGKYISGVDQYNAQGATNMSAQRANILNQFSQYNAGKRDYDRDYENTADSKYRANLAHGIDRLTAAGNQALTNRANLYAQNISESPDYFYNPRDQRMTFNSQEAMYNFMNRNKGGYQDDSSDMEKRMEMVRKLKNQGYTPEEMSIIFGGKSTASAKPAQYTNYPMNPSRSKVVSYGNPNYGGGYGYDYSSAYPGSGGYNQEKI